MKQEDTRERILEQALELFSEKGYDSVSVGEIARAVGIKAPSLYNHFPSKQAIFDAIVESTAAQYEADTGKIDIHVQNVSQDIPVFTEITAEALFEKVRQIFEYSLHNAPISRFRRMMTIEQFRSPELAALYSRRYVDRLLAYHAGIFRALIAAGELQAEAEKSREKGYNHHQYRGGIDHGREKTDLYWLPHGMSASGHNKGWDSGKSYGKYL